MAFDLSSAKPSGGFDLASAVPVDPRPSNMPAVIYPNSAAGPGANPPPTAQPPAQAPASAATPYQPNVGDTQDDTGNPDEDEQYQRVRDAAYTPQQREAAKAGVNIDASAPVSTFRAAFAAQQSKRDQVVADSIRQQLGPDTLIRTGPDAPGGGVQYWDKDTKEWKLANDSIGGKLVNNMPGALEFAGGTAGAFTPAPVIAGAVGAGLGRGAGVAIKNYVGNKLGLNDDVDQRDLPNATNEGLKSGGAALAGAAVFSGAPAGLRLLTKGEDIASVKEIGSVLDAYKANKGIVDQINDATAPYSDGQKLDLGVARTAAIPQERTMVGPNGATITAKTSNIDAVNMVNKEPIYSLDPKLQTRMANRRAANENVLDLYWQTQIENPSSVPNLSNENWQASLRSDFENYKNDTLGPYQDDADKAVQAAQQQAQQGPRVAQMDATTGGQTVRAAIVKAAQESDAKVDQAYSAYETDAKYSPDGTSSPYRVPVNDKLLNTIKAFDALKENGLLPSQGTQAARYTPKGLGAEGADQEDSALLKDFGIDAVRPEDQTMDLAMVDRTVKDLRAEWRGSLRGAVSSDMSDANRNRLLGALTDARDDFMAQPENAQLSASLQAAEAQYTRHTEEFHRSFAADFLTKDQGTQYRMRDANVLDAIMKSGNAEDARQLAGVVNGEPGAKSAILDYVNAYYNTNYTRRIPGTGEITFDPTKHQKFVDDVLPTLEPFLDRVDQLQSTKIGGLISRVQKAKEDWAEVSEKWNDAPSGRLGNALKNETFVNQFFQADKSFGDHNLSFIKDNLPDESLDQAKRGIVNALTNKARDPATGTMDPNALSRVFEPLRDRFTKWYGQDWVDNVDRFMTAYRGMNAQYGQVGTYDGSSLATKASRLVLGPLSAENRKLSFFKDMRAKSYANRLESAMYDPKQLSQLADDITENRKNSSRLGVGVGVGYDESNH